jgi:uncharacterized protein (TIGR03086 family)
MSEIADRYRRLSDAVASTIAAVPPERWGDPSPCEDWTARDVVGHLVQTQAMFLGFVGRELPAGPSVEEDPAAAWDHARAVVQADLDDPARAAAGFEGLLGPSTFEAAADRFLNTDLVVHRWDLARATGQDLRLDPDDMAYARAAMAGLEPGLRSPGAFGPELEAPEGADEQTAFLAWAGRRA